MEDQRHLMLAIDDDPDFLEALSTMLEANGFEVLQAGDADQALKLAIARKPEIIIVDLMMEEVDTGTSLVTRLRARGVDVPIYMLSTVGDALDRSTPYQALGLAGVFQKPVRPELLLPVLREKLKK
jgi:DNA-binding response OmpR family regulator